VQLVRTKGYSHSFPCTTKLKKKKRFNQEAHRLELVSYSSVVVWNSSVCACTKLPQLQILVLHFSRSEKELADISKQNGETGVRHYIV